MAKQQSVNGAGKLPTDIEQQRVTVIEMELKARYWKAQYEVMHYTLEASELQDKYSEHMQKQQKLQQEAMDKFLAEAKLMKEKMKEEEPVIN